jgi:hypothetical protein
MRKKILRGDITGLLLANCGTGAVESQQASGSPTYQLGLHRGAFVFMHGASRLMGQSTCPFLFEVNSTSMVREHK